LSKVIANRYEVEKLLGEGAAGKVYLVKDELEHGEILALKLLEAPGTRHLELMRHEFTILTKLKHPNIAQVYDFGFDEESGFWFYTSEYIEGRNIVESCRKLDYADKSRLFAQVLRALQHIHSRGVIHYDVKPGNVIINREGIARLIDFGLATTETPVSGAMRGTIGYAAPEVVRGELGDPRSDLYSLGVVLYEALTGKRPFERDSAIEALRLQASAEPEPPRKFDENVPVELEQIVLRLLERDPASRYYTANEVNRALSQAMNISLEEETIETARAYLLSGGFVGRDEELNKLQSLIDSPETDVRDPAVWFITGETGIGKSRLMREVGHYAQLGGIMLLHTRSTISKSRPFGPFADAVRKITTVIPRKIIKRFSSVVEILTGKTESADFDEPGRIMHESALLFLEAAKQQPLLLVIDDMEEADDDTLALLEHLARLTRLKNEDEKRVPLLVLCCCNTEIEETHRTIELIDRMINLEIAARMPLAPFSDDAFRKLISSMLGGTGLPDQVAARVISASGGNPLILMQTIQQLFDSGALFYETGEWRTSVILPTTELPGAGEEVLRHRLEKLSEDERAVVEAIACIARPGNFELVLVAAGIPAEACAASIEHLTASTILVLDEKSRYFFRSAKMAELALNSIPEDRRRSLYANIYEYYVKTGADVIERALQAEKAGIEADTLIPLLWEAAEHAEQVMAQSSAVRLYEALRRNLPSHTEEWYRSLHRLMRIYHRTGANVEKIQECLRVADHDSLWQFPELAIKVLAAKISISISPGALEEAQRFLETIEKQIGAKGRNRLHAEILTQKGRIAEHMGDLQKAGDCWTEARRIFASQRSRIDEINLLDYYITGLHYRRGKFSDAARHARRMLKRKTTKIYFAELHNILGISYWYKGKHEKALHHYQIALKRNEEIGRLRSVAYVRSNAANVFLDLNENDKALDAYTSAKQLFQILGDRISYGIALISIGSVHFDCGRTREALSFYEEVAELAESMDSPLLRQNALLSRGGAYKVLGNAGLALDNLNRALETARNSKARDMEAFVLIARAEVFSTLCGDIDAAVKDLDEACALVESDNPTRFVTALTDRVRLATFMGEIKRARGLIQKAEKLKVRGRTEGYIGLAKAEVLIETGKVEAAEKTLAELESIPLNVPNRIEADILWARWGTKTGNTDKTLQYANKALKTARQAENTARIFEAALTLALHGLAKNDVELTARHFAEAEKAFEDIASTLPEGYDRQSLRQSPFFSPLDDVDKWLKEQRPIGMMAGSSEEDLALKKEILKVAGVDESLVPRQGLALLGMITRLATTDLDVKSLLNLALAMVLDFTSAERGFIILVDANNNFRHLAARNILDEEIMSPEYEASHTMVKEVIRTGKSRFVKDISLDESLRNARSVMDLRLHSVLCVPIVMENRTIGVVYLDSTSLEFAFTRSDLIFVEAFAGRVAPIITRAVEQEKRDIKMRSLEEEIRTRYGYMNIVGRSKPMRDLFRILDSVTDTDLTVYIYGETGTGKELVAKALHYNGSRNAGPFVSINCGAMTESLLESELFGHIKGSFTGADSDKIGLIESADSGTLFLDEIGSTPLEMQVRLLRVIEEREVRQIGAAMPVPVDIRLVCSANTPLEQLVEQGLFREDLFYRLNVVRIDLPPLRERLEDIALLAEHFLKEFAEELKVPVKSLESEALARLHDYNYPGNIRQLRNIIQQALVRAGDAITVSDIQEIMSDQEHKPEPDTGLSRELSLDQYMKEFILANQDRYSESQLADKLGVSRKYIWLKRKKWNIPRT